MGGGEEWMEGVIHTYLSYSYLHFLPVRIMNHKMSKQTLLKENNNLLFEPNFPAINQN